MKKRMNWGILKTGGWEIMMKGGLRATAVNARIYGEANTNHQGPWEPKKLGQPAA